MKILVAMLLLTSAFLVIGRGALSDPVLQACEDALKGRLQSPASYERMGVSKGEEPLDAAAYREFLAARQTQGAEIAPGQTIQKQTSYHRYREDRGLGATPAIAECEYVRVTSENGEVVAGYLFLDGQSAFQRVLR